MQEFHITKVGLKSGQTVDIDYTEKVDVLKTAPSVENFLAEELVDTAQMQVSFLLADADSALTDSRMEVLKNTGEAFTTVDVKKVSAGENVFLLGLEEDATYTLHISAQYDRDSNALEAAEDHSGSLAVMKEIQLNIDYQFSFGNMSVETADGIHTEKFSKNQPVILRVESGNATTFRPDRAVVNGEIYPVEQSENGYFVTLNGFTQTGTTEIRVEQVVLENGKVFWLEKDNISTVMILKEHPEVAKFSAREDAKNGQFYIAFPLTDADHTLSNRKILIQKAEGKTVGEQSFQAGDLRDGVFSGTVRLTDTGLTASYMVQIVADCDLSVDGSETEHQKVLAEQEVNAQPRTLITAGKAGQAYVEKAAI